MRHIRLALVALLVSASLSMAQESGPSAGSFGVGYYGWIQSTAAIDVQYNFSSEAGLLVGLGFSLLDRTDFDIAAHLVYTFASVGSVKAQLAPGLQIGIPDTGDSKIAILLPLRAEYFVASNFSIHTMAGIQFVKVGDAKSLETMGDFLGSAGFTLWL